MNRSDVESLIIKIDELIFSHTGEYLDDLQHEILEGVIDHQKYADIAQKNNRSHKYVKETAGKLWKTLSAILDEDVNKSNFCKALPENESNLSHFEKANKLKIVTKLTKEGLTVEQISKVLQLPLELVKEQIEKEQ